MAQEIGFETAGKHPDLVKSEVFEEAAWKMPWSGRCRCHRLPGQHLPAYQAEGDNPAVAERFEIVQHGMEVANAYTWN